nr:MAG TPA: hypothetical protein [Caudoviricetes sp.]
MPEKTKNYEFNIYNDTTDGQEYFINYRLGISGTEENTNFVKIDDILSKQSEGLGQALQVATKDQYGRVKVNDYKDMITTTKQDIVDDNGNILVNQGTLTVTSVNVDKLYMNNNDELILDCGNAQ